MCTPRESRLPAFLADLACWQGRLHIQQVTELDWQHKRLSHRVSHVAIAQCMKVTGFLSFSAGSGSGAASEVRSILEDEATNVGKDSDNYWVLAAAVKRYIDTEGKGQLPIEVCLHSSGA